MKLPRKGHFIPFIITGMVLSAISCWGNSVQSCTGNNTDKVFTRSYRLYFKIDRWNLDTSFLDNGATIRRMKREIDSLAANDRIISDSIFIVSAASPDGGNAYNMMLSRKRGQTAEKLIRDFYPEFHTENIIRTPIGEDWETLRKVVIEDNNIPQREELLALIDSDLSNDEKERKLRAMRPTFYYILRHHVNIMRSAAVTISISIPNITLDIVEAPEEKLVAATGSIAPVQHILPPPNSLRRG